MTKGAKEGREGREGTEGTEGKDGKRPILFLGQGRKCPVY